jgi:hypothetical protein
VNLWIQFEVLRVTSANSLKMNRVQAVITTSNQRMKGGDYLAEMIENNIAAMSHYSSELYGMNINHLLRTVTILYRVPQ